MVGMTFGSTKASALREDGQSVPSAWTPTIKATDHGRRNQGQMRMDKNFPDCREGPKKRCSASISSAVEGVLSSVQIRRSPSISVEAPETRLGLRSILGSAGGATSDFSTAALDDLVASTCALAEAIVKSRRGSSGSRSPRVRSRSGLYDPPRFQLIR